MNKVEGKLAKCKKFYAGTTSYDAEIQEWLRNMAFSGYEFYQSVVVEDYIVVFVKEV